MCVREKKKGNEGERGKEDRERRIGMLHQNRNHGYIWLVRFF